MTVKLRLHGKVAVITGSGSGIGRATALLFATEGSRVMVADINSDGGQETVRQIREAGGEASYIQTDVSKVADLKRMIRTTVNIYGQLNVLYNHAGIQGPDGIEDVDAKEWQEIIDVNLNGGIFATKYAIPEMRRIGGGSIIFTASISGLVGSSRSPAYSATKGAVVLAVKSLALQLAADNIRVNCICPGPTDTPMLTNIFSSSTSPKVSYQETINAIPLGRLGKPEDTANAALFLASEESSYITGIALPVDGGYVAR